MAELRHALRTCLSQEALNVDPDLIDVTSQKCAKEAEQLALLPLFNQTLKDASLTHQAAKRLTFVTKLATGSSILLMSTETPFQLI